MAVGDLMINAVQEPSPDISTEGFYGPIEEDVQPGDAIEALNTLVTQIEKEKNFVKRNADKQDVRENINVS